MRHRRDERLQAIPASGSVAQPSAEPRAGEVHEGRQPLARPGPQPHVGHRPLRSPLEPCLLPPAPSLPTTCAASSTSGCSPQAGMPRSASSSSGSRTRRGATPATPDVIRGVLPDALPGGSKITFEPGGQLELSGPPHTGIAAACHAMHADLHACGARSTPDRHRARGHRARSTRRAPACHRRARATARWRRTSTRHWPRRPHDDAQHRVGPGQPRHRYARPRSSSAGSARTISAPCSRPRSRTLRSTPRAAPRVGARRGSRSGRRSIPARTAAAFVAGPDARVVVDAPTRSTRP